MKKFISFDGVAFEAEKPNDFRVIIMKMIYDGLYVLAVQKEGESIIRLCHGDLDYITEQSKRLYTEETDVINFDTQPKFQEFIEEKGSKQERMTSLLEEIFRLLSEEAEKEED